MTKRRVEEKMEILFNEETGKYYPEGKDQDFIHTILAILYANAVENK